jgi:hypothetical protein
LTAFPGFAFLAPVKVPESETIPHRSDSGGAEPPDKLLLIHPEVFDAPEVVIATATLQVLLAIASLEYENTETQLHLLPDHWLLRPGGLPQGRKSRQPPGRPNSRLAPPAGSHHRRQAAVLGLASVLRPFSGLAY